MITEVLLFVAVLIIFTFFNVRRRIQDWSTYGIKGTEFSYPFGTNPALTFDVIMNRKNIIEYTRDFYKRFKGEKVVGTYGMFGSTIFVVRDPELMKQMLVKDFDHFVDRMGQRTHDLFFKTNTLTDRIWEKQLSFVGGSEWKNIRTTFSPIFTSGHMKSMLPKTVNRTSK